MTWPDAVPFDPSRATASPAIEALLEGPGSAGPVVLLAVGPAAQRQGWAGPTAIALADAFSARGESVILADLSLENPELHALLGGTNEEGLTDVFLFGASLPHVMLTLPGRWFRLIPASAFTPDAREVLEHARWSAVFEELAHGQNKLIVYLPINVPGAASLSDRVGHTIVLAEPGELGRLHDVLSEDADVMGVLTPPEPGSEPTAQDAAFAKTDLASSYSDTALDRLPDQEFDKIRIPKDSAREALIADLRARQRAALTGPAPDMTPLPHEEPEPEEVSALATSHTTSPVKARPFPPRSPEPPPSKSRAWLTLLMTLLLVAAVVALGWYIWQTQFVTDAPAPEADPELVATPAAPLPAPAAPTAPVALPFSVAIASYDELSFAQERLDQLKRQEPRLPFYVSPVEVQSKLYYRVLAGPLVDSATAFAMRDSLVAKRIKTSSTGWEVLATPYAFMLGEYEQRSEAEAQQQQAAMKGVPSYILASLGLDGSPQYTLYAGAYTGPGDAEFMRQILRSVGLPDNLVERTGSRDS